MGLQRCRTQLPESQHFLSEGRPWSKRAALEQKGRNRADQRGSFWTERLWPQLSSSQTEQLCRAQQPHMGGLDLFAKPNRLPGYFPQFVPQHSLAIASRMFQSSNCRIWISSGSAQAVICVLCRPGQRGRDRLHLRLPEQVRFLPARLVVRHRRVFHPGAPAARTAGRRRRGGP